jgi:hypothetical protein
MAIRPLSPTAMMTIADERTNPKGERISQLLVFDRQ